jgi:hypothetical protein
LPTTVVRARAWPLCRYRSSVVGLSQKWRGKGCWKLTAHKLAEVEELLWLVARPVIPAPLKHEHEFLHGNCAVAVLIHLPDHLLDFRYPILVHLDGIVAQRSQRVLQFFLVNLIVLPSNMLSNPHGMMTRSFGVGGGGGRRSLRL